MVISHDLAMAYQKSLSAMEVVRSEHEELSATLGLIAQATDFDFALEPVRSMSADLHKYGYAAKGASTITYRNLDYLRYQMFVYQDWPGGVFAERARADALGADKQQALLREMVEMSRNDRAASDEQARYFFDKAMKGLVEGMEAGMYAEK